MQPPKLLKKPAETENPMEDSEYLYTQALGKALVGFAKALELRLGKTQLITVQDILEYSDVDKDEFEFLFKDAYGLLDAMKDSLKNTFTNDIKMLDGLDRSEQLKCIFKRLRKSTPILTSLRLIGDHTIWMDMLRTVFRDWTEDWPKVSPNFWEYIYRCFCCQFSSVLEKWEESGFKDELIPVCVQLVEKWLEMDASLAATLGQLTA